MGVAAADVEGRLAASVGELAAVAPCFVPALDVPNGGLLCALPALLAVGLLDEVECHLSLPRGYYGLDSLLILLAFMALARPASIESLRYRAPGEWGNLLGLDRVPEVRTLRAKIQLLARDEQLAHWSAALCERWMAAVPQIVLSRPVFELTVVVDEKLVRVASAGAEIVEIAPGPPAWLLTSSQRIRIERSRHRRP